ncbi:methylenetetrahydrofolate reductase [NAD(P)H] [Rhizobium calliandrae]|uniref:Methylenetetrahydrofolate reductase n=1 Tax=Rhizobium calliandrae TaxID=1312182 RepID=A0ABT7KJZ8_9HYPH|nr:methylenetetrahydrofolate reductase [NAD(P)H] [Rhizobium calliandrae]MDL2408959.1 methylenetetrahydrofolate reductase [NAD(P)H] [Rhizobium calliandrae]
MSSKTENGQRDIRISFEFFPPKSEEAETQLWNTVAELTEWDPDFVSVTYGAGGSTKAPTLSAVRRMVRETPFSTASHLTCVGATREETHRVIDDFLAAGVLRFVALRGDPPGGAGSAYQPHPDGYANAAELVSALRERGNFDISVSAYPEKHPESRDTAADIDMLKRKADNGADRALTQFFFDNDAFERYHDRVRAAGVKIPVVPGIMPIQNLTQLKRFAGTCGTSIPSWLDERFDGLDQQPDKRANVAADVAAEQIEDLVRRGINEFHLYTMNRSPLVSAVLERLGIRRKAEAPAGAAA